MGEGVAYGPESLDHALAREPISTAKSSAMEPPLMHITSLSLPLEEGAQRAA